MVDVLRSKTMVGFVIIILSIVCIGTNTTMSLEDGNYQNATNINE